VRGRIASAPQSRTCGWPPRLCSYAGLVKGFVAKGFAVKIYVS
jgi:hypothetical protein